MSDTPTQERRAPVQANRQRTTAAIETTKASMTDTPKPLLTKSDEERLAAFGVHYPWTPQDMLGLIDEIEEREATVAQLEQRVAELGGHAGEPAPRGTRTQEGSDMGDVPIRCGVCGKDLNERGQWLDCRAHFVASITALTEEVERLRTDRNNLLLNVEARFPGLEVENRTLRAEVERLTRERDELVEWLTDARNERDRALARAKALSSSSRMRAYAAGAAARGKRLADDVRAVPLDYLDAKTATEIIRILEAAVQPASEPGSDTGGE